MAASVFRSVSTLRCSRGAREAFVTDGAILHEPEQDAQSDAQERVHVDHEPEARRSRLAVRMRGPREQRDRDGREHRFDQAASAVEEAEEAALFVRAGDHRHALDDGGPERETGRQAPAAEDHAEHRKRRRGRIQQAERAGCDQREADQDARRDAVREPAARQIAEQENQAERGVQIAELAIGDMKHFEHRRLIDLPQIQDRVNGAGCEHEQRELQIALGSGLRDGCVGIRARAGKPLERVEMTRESPDDTYRDARVRRSCLRFVFDVEKSGSCRPPPAVLQYFMTTRRVWVNSSMPCLPSSPPRPERFQPAWKP